MKFIHLSDLHIHTHEKDNIETIATLDYVKAKYPDHTLIVTGDITDDGKKEQYEVAIKALEPCKGRVFVCPGNHDFGAAGNLYSRERAERFDRMLSLPLNQGGTFTGDPTPVVNIVRDGSTEVMLIALDTNLETEHPFDFACGEVGSAQLAALNTILNTQSSAVMKKILFFHHHPFMHGNPFMELKDAKELFRVVYGKVDVMLFGHKHASAIWPKLDGIPFVLGACRV